MEVHAYIDPTAGGILLQLVCGGMAALTVVLKLFGKRILHVLVPSRKRPP